MNMARGPMEILFQDEDYVAVNKPAGLLVHRSMIDRHETQFAMQLVRDQIGQRVFPVHRLDKPTSGILLFALHPSRAREMGALFTQGQVKKRYLAIVRGHTAEQGEIDYPLKEQLDRMTDAKADPNKAAQQAITAFRRLAITELDHPVGRYATCRYSLVELFPQTGRKHQLRRHMKHIFHPIIGDTTYGDGRHNLFFRQQFGLHRLLLAAIGLSFRHPISDQALELSASPGEEFLRACSHLGWSDVVQDSIQSVRTADG